MANVLSLSTFILVLFSAALSLRRISKTEIAYQKLCPKDVENINVPVENPCNVNDYIMCFNGVARFVRSCPTATPRFDEETQQCQGMKNVRLPASCNGQPSKNVPLTCAEGAERVANETTCRWYIECDHGEERPRPCQSEHYFIGDRCMPYMYHYAKAIDPVKLQFCKDLDKTGPLPDPQN